MESVHNTHCINLAINRISENYNAKEILDAKKEHREPVIIPHFSCHHLRHTFCSRLCENETNVKVIQEVMGHANIETTLDIYAEVNYAKKKEALENPMYRHSWRPIGKPKPPRNSITVTLPSGSVR